MIFGLVGTYWVLLLCLMFLGNSIMLQIDLLLVLMSIRSFISFITPDPSLGKCTQRWVMMLEDCIVIGNNILFF